MVKHLHLTTNQTNNHNNSHKNLEIQPDILKEKVSPISLEYNFF